MLFNVISNESTGTSIAGQGCLVKWINRYIAVDGRALHVLVAALFCKLWYSM